VRKLLYETGVLITWFTRDRQVRPFVTFRNTRPGYGVEMLVPPIHLIKLKNTSSWYARNACSKHFATIIHIWCSSLPSTSWRHIMAR